MSDGVSFEVFLRDAEIAELALRIEAVIVRANAFARMQHDVIAWDANCLLQKSAKEAFERRRRQHEVYIRFFPFLRDEQAGPLLPGWSYEFCPYWQAEDGSPRKPFRGWFPPELARESWPKVELPLPAPERELSTIERHAALAAIHDLGTKGVPKINPWGDEESLSYASAILEGRRPPFEGTCYAQLLNASKQVPVQDKPHIEAWIDLLEAELGSGEAVDRLAGQKTESLDFPVTLQQVAAVVGLSKRTLESYLKQGRLPLPDIVGGQGRANRWYWKRLRPHLQQCARRPLPEVFPGSRIIP